MRCHNKKNISGLTLTELMVSTILVGIVMVGVVSFNYAIQQIQSSTNKSALLSLQAATIISNITRNASKAVGYAGNYGIIDVNSPFPESLHGTVSFRQDRKNTPTDFNDDTWVIYVNDPNAHTLRICEQTEDQGGASPSLGAGGQCSTSKAKTLSKKVKDVTFWLKVDPEAHYGYVEISLTLRDKPNTNIDPITNPETTISTRISPPGHSW
ncbi:MAG: hypothetical protein HQL24_02140 [Candidatus Omnitrophica bacterium]|nr:hypothetical protein [Candidatus Omnitrophota bacterium]